MFLETHCYDIFKLLQQKPTITIESTIVAFEKKNALATLEPLRRIPSVRSGMVATYFTFSFLRLFGQRWVAGEKSSLPGDPPLTEEPENSVLKSEIFIIKGTQSAL